MKITVVGAGYVGLVAAACFAESGNDVIGVDVDDAKVEKLTKAESPIYEPGLTDLLKRNLKNARLRFTTSLKEGVELSDIIFIAVGTPQDEDGSADLTHVLEVAKGIGTYMNGFKTIVDKSTVPVGTARKVHETIAKLTKHQFEVVSNPEFLKEGAAIDDFMKPDRVVVGVPSERAAKLMRELYAPYVRTNKPILVMDVPSAELTKYASNSMLATRVSFMNEIANLCEKVGADIDSVRIGMGTDSRIGMAFLFPGIGYGGSCFPKDVQALIRTGKDYEVDLRIARSVEDVNADQKLVMVHKIVKHYGGASQIKGKTFAIWGLAFKPRTDDVREAPALKIIGELVRMGAKVVASDPEAVETFRQAFKEHSQVSYAFSNYDCLNQADGLVICTEWNEYRQPNFERMKQLMRAAVIFDGRNILDRNEVARHGYRYYSIGRPDVAAA
ncbi:MAG: UDP-glucose/GDP-mannose dehydrogenase family protein [Oligoflexia bacterium]|nr:UDP-glucose/GDP-mannose dehydrogenase family protein [Oligoflexia bacterium]